MTVVFELLIILSTFISWEIEWLRVTSHYLSNILFLLFLFLLNDLFPFLYLLCNYYFRHIIKIILSIPIRFSFLKITHINTYRLSSRFKTNSLFSFSTITKSPVSSNIQFSQPPSFLTITCCCKPINLNIYPHSFFVYL